MFLQYTSRSEKADFNPLGRTYAIDSELVNPSWKRWPFTYDFSATRCNYLHLHPFFRPFDRRADRRINGE